MNEPDTLDMVFKKVFAQGRLRRIPKHPNYRDVILAILSLPLQRRYPYTEPELNDELKSALAEMRADVDHVTARRYMVDLGFIKRDRAGMRYFLNYPKQQEILPEAAVIVTKQRLFESIAAAPQARHAK